MWIAADHAGALTTILVLRSVSKRRPLLDILTTNPAQMCPCAARQALQVCVVISIGLPAAQMKVCSEPAWKWTPANDLAT
jgi:hypothetical protein